MQSDFDGVLQLFIFPHFCDADGGAEMHGLHEVRCVERFNLCEKRILTFCPIGAGKPHVRNNGHAFRCDDLFRQHFIHRDRRSKYVAADERNSGHAQKAHQRAVLAVGAVHRWENQVNVNGLGKHPRPDEVEATFERKPYGFLPRKLCFVVVLLKKSEVVHRLVGVPFPFFCYVDRPHIKLSARDERIDYRRIRGDYGDVVFCTFTAKNDGYGFLHRCIIEGKRQSRNRYFAVRMYQNPLCFRASFFAKYTRIVHAGTILKPEIVSITITARVANILSGEYIFTPVSEPIIYSAIAAVIVVMRFRPGITLNTSAIMATAYIDYIILTHARRFEETPSLQLGLLLSEN